MSEETSFRLDTGKSTRNARFALTPLADAMFQLLVFFMLSSTLAPYSLLSLKPVQRGASEIVAQNTQPNVNQQSNSVVIWQVERGQIRAGKETSALENVSTLTTALRQNGIESVVLMGNRSATVQDVTTVLEALSTAKIPKVQLVSGR